MRSPTSAIFVAVACATGLSQIDRLATPGYVQAAPAVRDTAGVVETYVPSLPIGTGGLALDADGNLFVADFGAVLGDAATMGRTVRRVGTDGSVQVVAEGLEGASGNAFGPDGALYQSNIRGGRISRIPPGGLPETFATEGILGPVGLAFDPMERLYVANCGNDTIRRITAQGESTEFARDSLLACPNGLTFDDAGILYVANFDDGKVLRVDEQGRVSLLATLEGGNNGHLTYHGGTLYVVARGAHRIFAVSRAGAVRPFAGSGTPGGEDGPLLEASFNYPNDIVVSSDGRWMYVNETTTPSADGLALQPTRVRRIRMPG